MSASPPCPAPPVPLSPVPAGGVAADEGRGVLELLLHVRHDGEARVALEGAVEELRAHLEVCAGSGGYG